MSLNLEFTVMGPDKIHCESGEQRIGNALKRLPGVEDVKASAKDQRISVSIDPQRTLKRCKRNCTRLDMR